MYLDANNLYGWAMKQSLPYRLFTWMPEKSVEDWENILHNFETSTIMGEICSIHHEKFVEKHADEKFPDDWGLKTNGQKSRVAGLTFTEVAQDAGYRHWVMTQHPADPRSPRHKFKTFVSTIQLAADETAGLALEVDLE